MFWIRYWDCGCQSGFCFNCVRVWGGVGAVGGFGLDIGLCRLLVAVSLLCFSCVCVRWFGSDSGLHRLLVAVNLCCFSCVCACVGVDQIAGLVSY